MDEQCTREVEISLAKIHPYEYKKFTKEADKDGVNSHKTFGRTK